MESCPSKILAKKNNFSHHFTFLAYTYIHKSINDGLIFIGPRYPWSDLWVRFSLSERGFADLTDVTLADQDTNSILTDNVNTTIQGNVGKQVAPSGDQIWN